MWIRLTKEGRILIIIFKEHIEIWFDCSESLQYASKLAVSSPYKVCLFPKPIQLAVALLPTLPPYFSSIVKLLHNENFTSQKRLLNMAPQHR